MLLIVKRDCAVPAKCGDEVPPCNCSAGQTCVITSLNCDSCPVATCVNPTPANSQKSSGVSKGALAGAAIGVILLLTAVLAFIWYFHKRSKERKALEARMREPKPEVPASAEAVLSRPDPLEKPASPAPGHIRVFSSHSNTTINLDPESQLSQRESLRPAGASSPNPFADQLSLRSSSDQSHGQLIPIAILPPGTVQSPAVQTAENRNSRDAVSPMPSRPVRSPDLNLRLEPGQTASGAPSSYDLTHVNVSNDSVLNIRSAAVAQSVRSDVSGLSRASYLSTGTYATDLFTESPTIVTRQQGRILGYSKAQVVEVPSSLSNGGSPLASSHLSPSMSRRMTTTRSIRSPLAQTSFTPADIIEMDEQPEMSPFSDVNARQAGRDPLTDGLSVRTFATYDSQGRPWVDGDNGSIASGIEASITSATRVQVGINGRTLSPATADGFSTSSLASATRPMRYSFASEASSRADSILEAFPFVPPSPVSQHSFKSMQHVGSQSSPVVAEPPSPLHSELAPPDRRMIAMSTASHGSTTSSGLEAFPFEFQLESSTDSQANLSQGAARASLDTLALSRDLSAFPLAYDEEATPARQRNFSGPSRKSSTTRARH